MRTHALEPIITAVVHITLNSDQDLRNKNQGHQPSFHMPISTQTKVSSEKMRAIETFVIKFDDDKVVYEVGDVISGHVLVKLTDNIKCKAIYMKFSGKARTEWVDDVSPPARKGLSRTSTKYANDKVLLEERVNIWGKGKGDQSSVRGKYLSTGEYRFPFRLRLPKDDLPCSFEGQYGFVRYFASCVLERHRATDIDTREGFTILGQPIDLRRLPEVQIAMAKEQVKQVSHCIGSSGCVVLTASINRHGYTPGDRITINLDLANQSNQRVTRVDAILLQEVKYEGKTVGSSQKSERHTTRVAKAVTSHGCASNDSLMWNRKVLPLPPVPPSELRGCQFINIEYFVKVQAFVTGITPYLELTFPIIVHSVPASRLVQLSEGKTSLRYISPVPSPSPPPYSEGTNHTSLTPPPTYNDIYAVPV